MTYEDKFTLDTETIESAMAAFKALCQAFMEAAQTLQAWLEAEIAPLLAEISFDFERPKHKTPHKRSYKTPLFDKRSRVHHCRNDC